MTGTVHRLEAEIALLDLDPEHVLLVLLPVARRAPQLGVVKLRRTHLLVAALGVLAPAQVLEDVPDHHPLRVPERHSRRELREVEELQVLAESPVVAALRLLDPVQVVLQILRIEEGGPVDAR